MWPLHKEAYDWDRLFLMQARQARPGDNIYTHDDDRDNLGEEWDPVGLSRVSRNAKIASAIMIAIFLIIIPFSLYGSGYIFSRNFFIGWTVVVFVWSWVAALSIWCLPLWEARASFAVVFRGLLDRHKIQQSIGVEVESENGKEAASRKAGNDEKVTEVA